MLGHGWNGSWDKGTPAGLSLLPPYRTESQALGSVPRDTLTLPHRDSRQKQEHPSSVREHSKEQESLQQGARRGEGQQVGVTPCRSKAGGSLQQLQLFPPAATGDKQPTLRMSPQSLFLTHGK